MNQLNILPVAAALFLLTSFPGMARAHGNDITVTGEVITAIADERTGQVYELAPEDEKGPLPDRIKLGENITVVGDRVTKKGHTAIRIEKINP